MKVHMYKYAGVLPWARTLDGPVFLLGKELNDTWSDFGGSIEKGETPLSAAVREAWEESMAFFGTRDEIESMIDLNLQEINPTGVVYAIEIDYDPELPALFKRSREYHHEATLKYIKSYNNVNSSPTKSSGFSSKSKQSYTVAVSTDKAEGYLDKTDIAWYTIQEFIEAKSDIRKIARCTLINLVNRILIHLILSDDPGVYATRDSTTSVSPISINHRSSLDEISLLGEPSPRESITNHRYLVATMF